MINYLDIYNNYYPVNILSNCEINPNLLNSFNKTKLLVIGEIHGIKENSDALYSIISEYGADVLAIERPKEDCEDFINSVLRQKPNFNLIPKEVLIGSVLSIETIKAIGLLFKERKIKKVKYIGINEIEDVEKKLSENLLTLNQEKTVCIMGNWHTAIFKNSINNHISSLTIARRYKDITYLEYRYGVGQLFNAGTGLASIKHNSNITNISIKKMNIDDSSFYLDIPKANAISIV